MSPENPNASMEIQKKLTDPVGKHEVAVAQQWLTLKEASEFLGIHFTTLRTWADHGDIRVFRTPGGHRRFSAADLRRFLEERADHSLATDENVLVEAAVDLARLELQNTPLEQRRWHYKLDETATHIRQRRGRQLFALAISFVLKPVNALIFCKMEKS